MTVLLSFPRSGNHWVRFILEWFSVRTTYGCVGSNVDMPIYQKSRRCDCYNPHGNVLFMGLAFSNLFMPYHGYH